jgi:glycosyltransferase involved in cell wall biosynthesis
MKLLILEDQLVDDRSHHLQYLCTIACAAKAKKFELKIAANLEFSGETTVLAGACPLLTDLSRLSAKRLSLKKCSTLIRNIWANASTVSRLINKEGPFDRIMCLTSWWPQLVSLLVAKWRMAGKLPPFILLFVSYPRIGERPRAQFYLVRRLVKMLGDDVTLFAETRYAQRAWAEFLGRPVAYVVHPVAFVPTDQIDAGLNRLHSMNRDWRGSESPLTASSKRPLVFGFYGFARHEQGVDVLMRALELLKGQEHLNAEFRVLWPQGFHMPDGTWLERSMFYHLGPNVRFIEHPLSPTEYQQALADTDWLVLPYRSNSYKGRCSRVSIEACVMGIPVIYSKGTDLEAVIAAHGVGIGVEEEDPKSLSDAILAAIKDHQSFRQQALMRRPNAQEVFSGRRFVQQICGLDIA